MPFSLFCENCSVLVSATGRTMMLYGRENQIFQSHQFCLGYLGQPKGELKRRASALRGVRGVKEKGGMAQWEEEKN